MGLFAHDQSYEINRRRLYEFSHCNKQTSVMAGTLFHSSPSSFIKWFWAIYFLDLDKGSIWAHQLSKLIEVNWRTARLILRKLRLAMGKRDSLYQLSSAIELDDALIGGRQSGKQGLGEMGKARVVPTSESAEKTAGFITMAGASSIYHASTNAFINKHLKRG
ncbi:MAG: hypothetical protein ACI8R9_002147 [Paraglaciecola sp.]|jgi:hypothetical protein